MRTEELVPETLVAHLVKCLSSLGCGTLLFMEHRSVVELLKGVHKELPIGLYLGSIAKDLGQLVEWVAFDPHAISPRNSRSG